MEISSSGQSFKACLAQSLSSSLAASSRGSDASTGMMSNETDSKMMKMMDIPNNTYRAYFLPFKGKQTVPEPVEPKSAQEIIGEKYSKLVDQRNRLYNEKAMAQNAENMQSIINAYENQIKQNEEIMSKSKSLFLQSSLGQSNVELRAKIRNIQDSMRERSQRAIYVETKILELEESFGDVFPEIFGSP